ncbi:tyrosine-type recombinase/integrase [Spirosoma oryzicola]|uniref:tyrosine-type recombinase/integrase n=1 Tax=Spirosoma oryzicola TaxID=2898794 RepID=UPI001E42A757|nr:tyrosine-type recombinase/integrase [Spirosoma oryzicola]UHG91801.1 site-specific integrase [Spirosoma oryzicola]
MSSVTYKFVQNETLREDGTRLILLRITYKRKLKYVGTGVYVREKSFNPDGTYEKQNWIRKGHDNYQTLNEILRNWQDKAYSSLSRLSQTNRPFTADDIKRALVNNETDSFSGYIEQQIAVYQQREQNSNVRNHSAVLVNLRRFLNRNEKTGEVSFYELTPDVINQFETYLLTRTIKRPTTDAARRNTTTDYLRRIRQHITGYINKHNLPSETDPLRGKKLVTAPVNRSRLTEAELEVLIDADFSDIKKGRKVTNSVESWARDLYVCSYYLHGIRGGDLVSARCEQLQQVWHLQDDKPVRQWRFSFISDKKDKPKTIVIEEPALSIMLRHAKDKKSQDFIFPFMRHPRYSIMTESQLSNAVSTKISDIDKVLKRVATHLDIPKNLTLHTARHTFAEHLFDMTENVRLVQQALGHQSIITTERYLSSFNQDFVDKANVLYKRRSQLGPEAMDDKTEQILSRKE